MRFTPVIDPRFTYRSENVVETLDRACGHVGYPKAIRVDQGTEFASKNLGLWGYAHGVALDFSRPDKPTDNAFIEAFNGRFRAGCLNAHWLLTLADAANPTGGEAKSWRLGAETPMRSRPMGPSATGRRSR